MRDLKAFAGALDPRMLVPVHTEYRDEFKEHFNNVMELEDGQKLVLTGLGSLAPRGSGASSAGS